MKRKYQFRTREGAEQAARELQLQRDNAIIALNAVLHGTVKHVHDQWDKGATIPQQFGNEDGYYTFAVVPRMAGCVVIVTYHCPKTGQKPHTAVYWESWVQEEIDRFQIAMPNDNTDVSYAYREGLYHLRRLVSDCNNCAA